MAHQDLLGFENHTATALPRTFSQMQSLLRSLSRSDKATLLYPLRHLSLTKAENLGFAVGENLWQAEKEWDTNGPLPYGRRPVTDISKRNGVKRHIQRLPVSKFATAPRSYWLRR